jgi:hypothetical protein
MAVRRGWPTLCAKPLSGCVSKEAMPIARRQISAHGSPARLSEQCCEAVHGLAIGSSRGGCLGACGR